MHPGSRDRRYPSRAARWREAWSEMYLVESAIRELTSPLPLWERSGRIEDAIRVRGFSPRLKLRVALTDATPHPSRFRATFSRKGRRKRKNAKSSWENHHGRH